MRLLNESKIQWNLSKKRKDYFWSDYLLEKHPDASEVLDETRPRIYFRQYMYLFVSGLFTEFLDFYQTSFHFLSVFMGWWTESVWEGEEEPSINESQ